MADGRDESYVLRQVRETGVELIRLWFADVSGRLKEVAITEEQLEAVLDDGLAIDGGVMGGPSQDESELVLAPDADTFAVLPVPGRDGSEDDGGARVARMFCDVLQPDGRPAPDDTRGVLKAALRRAARRAPSAGSGDDAGGGRSDGFTFYVGCEVEHFYLQGAERPLRPTDRGGRYDPGLPSEPLAVKRETLSALEQLGVGVDFFHHEDAPGQYKMGLQYSDALTMADSLVTYRQVVRQVARRHGLLASFMPKPFTDREGSGVHYALSLARQEENAFYDPERELGLSSLARSFVAGLLEHGRAVTLVTNPTVNSYKRLMEGFSAPVACTWAHAGRGDMVRVPTLQTGHGPTSTRLEYRVADPSCNPYLALATLLEAGLDGWERGLEPPARRAPGTPLAEAGRPLPRHLDEAIVEAERSGLLAQTLGEGLHRQLLETARREWADYHARVSDWELERYLF